MLRLTKNYNLIKLKCNKKSLGETPYLHPLFPKLFTLALEHVFEVLTSEKKGIKIDGSNLNNLSSKKC